MSPVTFRATALYFRFYEALLGGLSEGNCRCSSEKPNDTRICGYAVNTLFYLLDPSCRDT